MSCPYCRDRVRVDIGQHNNTWFTVRVADDPKNPHLWISAPGRNWLVPINNCPMCGRDLRGGAE